MQTQDFTNLLNSAAIEAELKRLNNPRLIKSDVEVLKEMTDIEKSNNDHLVEKNLPDYMRTPTAEELVTMRQFAIEYKRANKNASKREIRRATQKQFNIRIFR